MSDAGTTRRTALALALSLLVHAGSVAAFRSMPFWAGPDAPVSVEFPRGEPLRPVQVTLVPMLPPRPFDVTPRPSPRLPESALDDRQFPPERAPELAPPAPLAAPAPDVLPRVEVSAAAPVGPREPPPTTGRAPRPDVELAPLGSVPPPEDAWSGALPPPPPPQDRAGKPGREARDGPDRTGIAAGAEVADFAAPEYPPQSRRLGEEGLVLLEVEILPDGRAGRVRILHDPGYPRLVAAAVEAVRKATFKPAMKDGAATRSVVEIPIRFRLQ